MSAVDWAALIVSAITILGAFVATVKFIVKHYLAELKPNGGASMNDRVRRLEGKVDQIYYMLVKKDDNEKVS